MMEYKPGNGYSGDGFNHKRVRTPSLKLRLIIRVVLFYGGLFVLTAMIFGWWSIVVDIALMSFFVFLSNSVDKKIEKRKLDKLA